MRDREGAVEDKLSEGVKALGGITRKWTSPNHAGVPDQIVIIPGGEVWFVEVKTRRGKLSGLQARELRRLSELGANTYVVYGEADVLSFLKMLENRKK